MFKDEVELPAEVIRDVDDGVVYVDLDEHEARAYAHAGKRAELGWAR